jgi:predicted RNA binding protein YcfA (HicA-like mRNA interferase family)
MPELPVISGKDMVGMLERDGFELVRVRGSHCRMKHIDGRVTTIPIHKNNDLPKELLRKIIREDLQISVDAFIKKLKR